jgi:hypothetical protein
MKFKEFKIDLGGSFPAKVSAIKRHALNLGYSNVMACEKTARYIYFSRNGCTGWNGASATSHREGEWILLEKFLELTKEDVIEKEPEIFYRYRIWRTDGDIVESAYFYRLDDDGNLRSLACNSIEYRDSKVIRLERIGEGVSKCEGQ